MPPVSCDDDVAQLEVPRLMEEQEVDDGAVAPSSKCLATCFAEAFLDVRRIDGVIRTGASGHFGYGCVHVGSHRLEVTARGFFGLATVVLDEVGELIFTRGPWRCDTGDHADRFDS